MAVSLPTADDVRRARVQAAKSAAERAELARTPFYAALGAGDFAVAAVTKAVTDATKAIADARARAAEAQTVEAQTVEAQTVEARTVEGLAVEAQTVEGLAVEGPAVEGPAVEGSAAGSTQHRFAVLPHNAEELRTALDELRVQIEKAYAEFAERGEQTWSRIRTQPGVQQAVSNFGSYTEKLDARVDHLVEEARDAGEKALGTVSRQTRSTGEKVARSTQRFAAGAAQTVGAVTRRTSDTVAEKGAEVAGGIATAGDDVAHDTRSAARTMADRTAPAAPSTAADQAAALKPGAPRIGPVSTDTPTGS